MPKTKKYKLVVFDQDGVLVLGDALDDMADQLGAHDASAAITRLWHDRKIDLTTAIARKLDLLNKFTRHEVEQAKNNIKYDPEAFTTVADLRRRGVKTMIITGSPEITARHSQTKLGLDYYAATTKDLTLEKENKIIPLAAKLRELGITFADIIVVGDSFSDEPMLQRAGLGLVIRPRPGLAEKFKEIKSLGEVLEYI